MKLVGELYKEKVLSLPKEQLRHFELPLHDPPTRIVNELFGWKLYYRKLGRKSEEHIGCRSEEEARFIKVFLDLEGRELYIPLNDNYLKEIVPEFEYLKRRTDEILGGYLKTIFQRRYREQLRFMVYREVLEI